jgi:hypothetical protein
MQTDAHDEQWFSYLWQQPWNRVFGSILRSDCTPDETQEIGLKLPEKLAYAKLS